MKKLIYTFFFSIILIPCFIKAQEINRFITTGIGAGHISVRDLGMSPLLYSGVGYFSSFSYNKRSVKKIKTFELNIAYGKIKHKKSDVGILHNGRVEIKYDYFRNIVTKENYTFFLGANIGVLGGYRYQPFFLNSAHNYDIVHSAGISSLFNYKFWINKKPLVLSSIINIPIISDVIRPAYASPLPEGLQTFRTELSEAYFKSIQLMSIRKFFRITNCMSANYPILGNDKIGLSYQWEYFQIKTDNSVGFASQRMLLSYFIFFE